MDFELLGNQPYQPNPYEDLERALLHRKRAFHTWIQIPPHALGACLLLLTAFELVISRRLTQSLGAGPSVAAQVIGMTAAILATEAIVMVIAAKVGEIAGKTGNPWTLITFFNVGLIPLLVFLPMALVAWVGGSTGLVLGVLMVLLALKVLSNWREALETVFKFSRLQSALVLSISGLFLALTAALAGWIHLAGLILAN